MKYLDYESVHNAGSDYVEIHDCTSSKRAPMGEIDGERTVTPRWQVRLGLLGTKRLKEPAKAKEIGRAVRGFISDVWERGRPECQRAAIEARMRQHPLFMTTLINEHDGLDGTDR